MAGSYIPIHVSKYCQTDKSVEFEKSGLLFGSWLGQLTAFCLRYAYGLSPIWSRNGSTLLTKRTQSQVAVCEAYSSEERCADSKYLDMVTRSCFARRRSLQRRTARPPEHCACCLSHTILRQNQQTRHFPLYKQWVVLQAETERKGENVTPEDGNWTDLADILDVLRSLFNSPLSRTANISVVGCSTVLFKTCNILHDFELQFERNRTNVPEAF
jgi:hypothetical protein